MKSIQQKSKYFICVKFVSCQICFHLNKVYGSHVGSICVKTLVYNDKSMLIITSVVCSLLIMHFMQYLKIIIFCSLYAFIIQCVHLSSQHMRNFFLIYFTKKLFFIKISAWPETENATISYNFFQ